MSGLAVRMLMASDIGSAVCQSFADWIGRQPTKVIARRFGASPRTVKAWRNGTLPEVTTLIAMVEAWGEPFLEFIFAPVLAESDLGVDRRIARIEGDLAALKKEMGNADLASDRGAVAGSHRGLVRRARQAALASVAAALIAVTALQQMAPQHDDMGRVRHASSRIVRVVRGGRENA